MKLVGALVLAVITAFATTRATLNASRPSVHVEFSPASPTYLPAETRPAYKSGSLALKIITDQPLEAAFVRLLTITKEGSDKPLTDYVEPTFGWPLGKESFQPRTIADTDYVIIATVSENGHEKHAHLFLNEFSKTTGPEAFDIEELKPVEDLGPGTYHLKAAVIAKSFSQSVKFRLVLKGDDVPKIIIE